MEEVLALARRVLDRAGAGWQVEAYVDDRLTFTAQAGTSAAIRYVGRAQTRGVGVRAVRSEHVGYASTADLSDSGLDGVVRNARDNAEASDADPVGAELPPPAAAPAVEGLALPALTSMVTDDKLELVAALAKRAMSVDSRVRGIDTAQWRDQVRRVAIASTCGVSSFYETAFAELWTDVLAEDDGVAAQDDASWWGRDPRDVDVEQLAATAVSRTTRLLGPLTSTTAFDTVVLDPAVSGFLLQAIGRGFTGGALANRRSPFSGRHGESVAAPWLNLSDDGLYGAAPAAAPFDDEGVPRRRTPLIDGGVLVGALHSAATAASLEEAGVTSTGNARRATYKAAPRAAATTLRLEPWRSEDGSSAEGCYVQQITGSVAGISSVTGRVNLGGVGYRMLDGEPAGRLQTVPIATTLLSLLGELCEVSEDTQVIPDCPALAPTLAWRPAQGLSAPR